MKSNYEPLGNYIKEIKIRNSELQVKRLLGINIDKFFMPSVANVIGTDLSTYKVVKKYQFACNRMHVGRDHRVPIAVSKSDEDFIISPAYDVFEIIDQGLLDPDYLMMWFMRNEYDRNAWFFTDADVRGGLSWKSFCEIKLPIPVIEKQKKYANEFHVIQGRISHNEAYIAKLEEVAQAIYKAWFIDFEFNGSDGLPYMSNGGKMSFNSFLEKEIPDGWSAIKISDLIEIRDGTHDSPEETEQGHYLVTSTHLNLYDISFDKAYRISKEEFEQINKRSKVDKFDILFSMIGTVGLVNYVLYDNIDFAIKNVALFKTSLKKNFSEFVLFYLKSDYMKHYLTSNPNGSTQNYVTLGFLRDMPIVIPPEELIISFKEKIGVIINQIHLKTKENMILKQLRDLHLSRLSTS